MIITFFGHSNYLRNKSDESRVLALLESLAKMEQVDFYLGSYGQFDNFALMCARKYKEKHPGTRLFLICPYLGDWIQQRSQEIGKYYDGSIYPNLENVTPKLAIIKRNEWMVKQSDHIITYIARHSGGAYRALLYARKNKIPYTNLYEGKFEPVDSK